MYYQFQFELRKKEEEIKHFKRVNLDFIEVLIRSLNQKKRDFKFGLYNRQDNNMVYKFGCDLIIWFINLIE